MSSPFSNPNKPSYPLYKLGFYVIIKERLNKNKLRGMATDYLQVFLDKTTDRDVTCYFYHRVLNCSYKQISDIKHLTVNQVKHSISKVIRIEEMPDKISALTALFCDFREKE